MEKLSPDLGSAGGVALPKNTDSKGRASSPNETYV
jgi:hypothetical protein